MSRVCTICVSPDREQIDQQLLDGVALRDIAGRCPVSKTSLARHKADHIPAQMVQAQSIAEVCQADTLLAQVESLQAKAMELLGKAEAESDLRTALVAVKEARSCLELKAKLEGQLQDSITINILSAPEWLNIRSVLLQALQPHGEARLAVSQALLEIE
jgi:hypothetical protein